MKEPASKPDPTSWTGAERPQPTALYALGTRLSGTIVSFGDNALFGSLELRSPSLLSATRGEWRFYVFSDAGWLKVNNALPGQKNHFDFLSYGIGSRWRFLDHFDGSVIASFPVLKQGQTEARAVRIGFKAGFDY